MIARLCVLWELDSHSYGRFQELSRAVMDSPFLCASFHPHITLACYDAIDARQLEPWVREFASTIAPFPVRFEEVGLLSSERSACFPAYAGPLKQHYQAFHRRFGELADRWTSPQTGLYTPHVSLYDGPGMVDRAAQQRLAAVFRPFDGQVQGLGLSLIKGVESYEMLSTYSLTGGA